MPDYRIMDHFVLSPLTWGLLLALLLALSWRRLGVGWRVGGGLLLLVVLALWTPLGANALIGLLEARTPLQIRCKELDRAPIVVLSGGLLRGPRDAADYAALNLESFRRLRHAVVLWHHDGGSTFVIAGGGPYAVKESMVLARLARDWGVPGTVIRTETDSTTTWQSAFELRYRLPRHIRLVSSALHLPRARIAFQAAGFAACTEASGSDYLPMDGLAYLLPQTSALAKSEAGVHELVGTLQYKLRAGDLPDRSVPGGETPGNTRKKGADPAP